jgi:FkbH-like protein
MSLGAEAIRALVENAGPDLRRVVQTALALAAEHGVERKTLRAVDSGNSVGCRWLRAALTEKLAGPAEAAVLWQQVVAQNGCEIPDVLLHRARSLARGGQVEGAAKLLRIALQNSHDYDLFIRAESLARKCSAGFDCKRSVKVALLGSCTTALLRSVFNLLFLRDAIDAEFYEPPFGTYAQELLTPDSGLRQFQPDFILLLLNWRDLGLPQTGSETETTNAITRIQNLWRAALDVPSARVIQLTFSPPPSDPGHELSSLMEHGTARSIRKINESLYQAAGHRITLIDSERIAAAARERWEDPVLWSSAKVYPAPSVLPIVAEHVVSCIRAEMGWSRKLLVLDLDNTLWGGVIGEDGLAGIKLGPPSSLGERYQEFQIYLKGLRERGVLLALASKNNREDAAEVFQRHPGTVLHADDFVAFKVNWEDKTGNIRQIASELRLGLDSFVFLDDNPAERNAVRRELPQVIVPEIPGEPTESISALERGLYFQAVRLTEEDRSRNASYSAEVKRAELSRSMASVSDYLAELSMQIDYGQVDGETSVRVTQLINKTNQFNLTTRRYTHEEIQARMASPLHWCRWYRLKDRFADHGVIGVVIADIAARKWTVDTWLMSCRVIGREVESFMFRDLVECACAAGAEQIKAQFIPTAKNALVRSLLPRFGFAESEPPGSWVLDVSSVRLPDCSFFREDQAQVQITSGGNAR